jgi:hypothetical protein
LGTYRLNHLQITVDKQGAGRYTKASYPVRYGRFCEIRSPEHLFQFNLNGEAKYIRGITPDWPHPAEWLKRSDANDWVFYSIGGYHRIFDSLGEYYLPCLPYASNSIWLYNPFDDPYIQNALNGWRRLQKYLSVQDTDRCPLEIREFLDQVARHDEGTLQGRADKLHRIIGSRVSVLPPDARHVDYEVIPLMISDGCLYQCGFCRVKSGRRFAARTRHDILLQIRELTAFYGPNLKNYNALFLGNHDALAAGKELIRWSAMEAYKAFGFKDAHISGPALFLFGSVDSLLNAADDLFEALNRLPFYTYINIGLESADSATLAHIRKPLETRKIEAAFMKMIELNRSFLNLEITANFLIGSRLSQGHYESIVDLVHDRLERFYSKGGIYFSPLDVRADAPGLLQKFFELKSSCRLPAFIYLIQRL